MKLAIVVLGGVLLAGSAEAACTCACVNGEMKPLCESSIEIAPICGPQICPIVPPSIAPIEVPRIPPLGASSCRQAQVFNQATGEYRWQSVCR